MSIWVRKGKPGELELVFPYNEEYIAKVKEMRGRRWDKDNKKWILPDSKESLEQLQKVFAKGELVTDKNISSLSDDVDAEKGSTNDQFLGMMRDVLKLKGYSTRL